MPGMTLRKAIEILSNSAYAGSTTFDQDFKDAEKLGMEAMKRLKTLRTDWRLPAAALLPGETEE